MLLYKISFMTYYLLLTYFDNLYHNDSSLNIILMKGYGRK